MVRPGRASPLGGVVVYGGSGSCGVGGDVVLGDLSDKRMTDEDVVDQFLAAPVDSAESLLGRNTRGEVPKPLRVTVVGAVKAGGTNLRARWSVEDLGGGGLDLVEHDNGTLRMAGKAVSGGGAHGGGFGAATVERVGGEPPSLGFIVRAEPPSGERQQLGFEVRGNDFDVDAAEADTNLFAEAVAR